MSSAPVTAWAPLREVRFRVTWTAFLGAQLVIWAQTVGAVDVITAQTDAAAPVAAVQAAISLPGVVLALLAGAVADVLDRRLLLVRSTLVMAAAMAALAVATALEGVATPAVVLALTVVLGAGLALFVPIFIAMVPDLVPRPLLAPAVSLGGVSVNLARAAGPALAGLMIGALGASGLFWALAAVLCAVTVALAVRGPRGTVPERPERIREAIRAGARYARHAPPLRRVTLRTALYVVPGSAMWAILPVIAVRSLGLDASGFGLLLGCVGVGAVVAALLLAAGAALMATVLAALAVLEAPAPAAAVLMLAGASWITVMTAMNTVAQSVTPAWVRGRAIAAWLLAYQGGLTLGSIAWGLVADVDLQAALLIPAAVLAVAALGPRLLPLPGHEDEPAPASTRAPPVAAAEPDGEAGPVLIVVDYEVDPEHADAFVGAMQRLSAVRRRDGARRWHLYRDVADPAVFTETFEVASWAEHLRQHDRLTHVDLPLEEEIAALARGFSVRHLLSAAPSAARRRGGWSRR